MSDILFDTQVRVIKRRVFFTGSTALVKGQGLCYDRDYGTAADADGRRDKRVELPTTSNNLCFAGVTLSAYDAVSGGQWIEIAEPGSVVEVAVGVDTVVNSTMMTCAVGTDVAGRFVKEGFPGRGTALALQTNASGVLASDYTATATLDATALILTDSGATFVTAGLAAGDSVYIVAGEDDGTDSVTAGKYTIASVDSETQLTLTAVAGTTGGTMEVSYFAQHGNQVALAYLFDGEESGLIQFISPTNGASACMVAGVTYIHGGTNPGGDSTFTLANGTRNGMKKGFYLLASYSSNDFLVTVTAGITMAGGALANFELDAADECAYLQWYHSKWRAIVVNGAEA